MNICIQRNKNGFTLIELLVVIAIITILVTIVLAAMSTARQNTREKKRVSDLGNIELALTLFKEGSVTHVYPAYTSGAEIGIGGAIDAVLKPLNGTVPTDPSRSGTGGTYGYWFDSSFTCSAPGQAVIYAKNMEQSKNSNFATVCTDPSPSGITGGSSGTYIVVLKQ